MKNLKKSVNDVVLVDYELKAPVSNILMNFLFGKFLGKAPPLEVVKNSLMEMWKRMGPFSVSDMPNGFYLIRCEKLEMIEAVLCKGPWTIGGMVLQLTPWKGHL